MTLTPREIERRKHETSRPLREKYPHLGLWIVGVGLALVMTFVVLAMKFGH